MRKILAIDPSSSVTGWALIGADRERVLDAGLIAPKGKMTAVKRIHRIGVQLEGLVYAIDGLHSIIIETSSGHVNEKRHKGKGSGLAVYGMAVGYYIGLLYNFALQNQIGGSPMSIFVQDESWTGRRPKLSSKTKECSRQDEARLIYPKYDPKKDKGGDVSDAICLGMYFTRRCKVPGQQTWEEWGK